MHADRAAALPLVDALKGIAAQLIVLHHLAFYGPMSDAAAALAPTLMAWLSQHARLAVQVFLVVGGFLAARQLAPQARLVVPAVAALWTRALRLLPPYAVALLLTLAASALVRPWLAHPVVPAPPEPLQLLAHALLVQDLLDVDALSAGIWYVAIDLQLHALLLALLALAAALERRLKAAAPLAPWAVAALLLASAWGFNRDPAWDVAAPYFFAAYGLGVLAGWRGAGLGRILVVTIAVGLALAWLAEPRSRLALAALLATTLVLAAPRWRPPAGRVAALLRWLGRTSYALFLVHFAVCLLVSAVFTRWLPPEPAVQAFGMALAWAASLAAAALFERHVERPLARRLGPRASGSALAAG